MPDAKDLPKSELEIMGIVWRKGKVTVRDVWLELSKRRKLNYKTVATLLMRLRDRGYVEAEEKEFAYVFRPLVSRVEVIHNKLDDLVAGALEGDLTPIALYMAKHGEKLSPAQISALEEIVRLARMKEGK